MKSTMKFSWKLSRSVQSWRYKSEKTTRTKMSGTRSPKNTSICWMYSKTEKTHQYLLSDQVSTWKSTGRKEEQYQSRKWTTAVTTNCMNSIDTSKRMKLGDGFEG